MSPFEAIMRALKNFGKRPENDEDLERRSEEGQAASEELNKMLPEQVSGRGALLSQRAKLSKIDRMLEEANQ